MRLLDRATGSLFLWGFLIFLDVFCGILLAAKIVTGQGDGFTWIVLTFIIGAIALLWATRDSWGVAR